MLVRVRRVAKKRGMMMIMIEGYPFLGCPQSTSARMRG